MGNVLAGLLVTVATGAALLGAAWAAARWPRARLALLALPMLLGATFAISALRAPHGYAASYDFAGAWVTSLCLGAVGAVMCVPRAGRRAGSMGLVAGLVVLSSFYAIYLAGYGLGLHAWQDARPVPIPATPAR